MNRRALLTAALALPAFARTRRVEATGVGLSPLSLASGWLGRRQTAAGLRDRVVLIDIFTFECINCVHVTPNLKRLYARYDRTDLEIVAVHTPEVPSYQSKIAYLARQTRDAALPWPIAIDNSSRIWNAYGVDAWPTQLLFDRAGRLREKFVGEGNDDEVDAAVGSLIREI
jgi:thiol-disulfide isomerase/thioredoxin